MDVMISKLNEDRDRFLQVLRGLNVQRDLLRETITELKEEERQLKKETEALEEAEEIKPEVEEFVKEVTRIDEEANVLLGRIAPLNDMYIHKAVIEQIKDIGIGNAKIESIPIRSDPARSNIIVKIPASDAQYDHLPKIILNAHIDTVRNNGYWFSFRNKKEFIKTGALDDRAGVVAILHSLRRLKQKWESDGMPHGPIWIIFTDLEEKGFAGAEDLKDKYQGEQSQDTKNKEYKDLFDDTHLIVTVDGPLIYPPDPKISVEKINPFVIAGSYNKSDKRHQAFERAVSNLNHPNFHKPDYPSSDGAGDHHIFRKIKDKRTNNNLLVINLRAPHTYLHDPNETTYIEEQLVPMAQWISESIFELSRDLIPFQAIPQTSAIVMRLKEGDQLEIFGNIESPVQASLLPASSLASSPITENPDAALRIKSPAANPLAPIKGPPLGASITNRFRFAITENELAVLVTLYSLNKLNLDHNLMKVKEDKTDNFLFVKFKAAQSRDKYIYAIVPLFSPKDLWRDYFWRQRSELYEYFKGVAHQNIKSFILDIASQAGVLVNGIKKGYSGLLDTYLANSQNKFNEIAAHYASGISYDPAKNILGTKNYSHTELFGWIYFIEALVVEKIAKDAAGDIAVLELGSSFGNSIFTKQELLKNSNINYVGIDKLDSLLGASRRYAVKTNVRFSNLDLLDNGWREKVLAMNGGRLFDVVTSSHLLEHLGVDPVKLIKDWLSITRSSLVISVPFEDNVSDVSERARVFDASILKKVAMEAISNSEANISLDDAHIDSGTVTFHKSSSPVSSSIFGNDLNYEKASLLEKKKIIFVNNI